MGAVSDVLVTSDDCEKVFLGKRKVEPQPDWWYIGGRVRPGETTIQGAAKNVRRELKLDLAPERFEVIANYSFVWRMRAQAPAEHGTADLSTVHHLRLSVDEVSKVQLDEKEYSDARWFGAEEVLAGEFPPALKQAIRDLRAKAKFKSLEAAVEAGADDASVASLARDLARLGSDAPKVPVQIQFDIDSRKYTVTAKESGTAGGYGK